MAAPVAPDLTSLVSEGLDLAGYPSPSTALTSRAQVNWMREIKNDIWRLGKSLKSLQMVYPMTLVKGQAYYELPSDFSSLISLEIMDGVNSGTASAGAVGTTTLEAGSSFTEEFLQGKELFIYSGTGLNQISHIVSYNTSTLVATIEPDFAVATANLSKYIIVDSYLPVVPKPTWDAKNVGASVSKQKPSEVYILGDENYGKLLVNPIPEKTYGLKIRYYANLQLIDLASTTMTTLYKNWETIWIQGVYARGLRKDDRANANDEINRYRQLVKELVGEETYGMELHELQRTVD